MALATALEVHRWKRGRTGHSSVDTPNIGQYRYLGEFIRKLWVVLQFLAGHLGAPRRVQEGVHVEVAEGNPGTGRLAMESGIRVCEDIVGVGEEVIKEVVL